MIRAVLVATAVVAAGLHTAATAGAEPQDVAVPGMHSGAVETQPCTNWEQFPDRLRRTATRMAGLMALIENPQVCSLKFPTRGPWLL
jgi:hypothetical protein